MTKRNESRRPRAQAVGLDTHAVMCDHGGAESRPQLVIRPEGPGWTRLRALTLSHAVGLLRLSQLGEFLQVDQFRFLRFRASIDARPLLPWATPDRRLRRRLRGDGLLRAVARPLDHGGL